MKISHLLAISFFFLATISFWLTNERPEENTITQKKKSQIQAAREKKKALVIKTSISENQTSLKTMRSEHVVEEPAQIAVDPNIEADIKAIISEVNLSDWMALESLKSDLKTMDSESVGRVLTRTFKAIKPHDALKRDVILELAKSLDSPHMFLIWQDVLNRETPRFNSEQQPDQEKPHGDDHASVNERIIAAEQAIAIRELGQIAGESGNATELLWSVIVSENDRYNFKLRKQAATTILEVKPTYGLKLAQQLDPDDPLREFIKSMLLR